ncbi:hypothetical protein MWU52_10900 [Jannaschia sp. S6380]|nr:hypothetical protein [Jannaschia sp. S6380]MCK0168060.1 hypothetical protein [Jannaschia sp. S6380]
MLLALGLLGLVVGTVTLLAAGRGRHRLIGVAVLVLATVPFAHALLISGP